MKKLLPIITICLSATTFASTNISSLNDGWKFKECEQQSNWEEVNLPHCWNADAYVFKDYRKGKGYYRRALNGTRLDSSRRYYLKFEGASKGLELSVNGQKAGEHKGGYTAYIADITDYISFNEDNIIDVIVDNSLNNVAPISADFTFFGGIYRDLWLIDTPALHFDISDMASPAIKVYPSIVDASKAELKIKVAVANDSNVDIKKHKIRATLLDPQGNIESTKSIPLSLKCENYDVLEIKFNDIITPQLWSPESPALYSVVTEIVDPKGNIIDNCQEAVGFRWFSFDPDSGFYLNGSPYKLRGVCRHQDQKPIGYALSDEMHRRDMQLIKEMGANFIRISHYPQDDAILEMADRLGLIVWEEIPVINIVPETEGYDDNCETNLREMIRQHFNHPSIVMWGYMNEIMLETGWQLGGDPVKYKAGTERALRLATRLEKVLHEEDSSRLSTMAFHGDDVYNKVGLGEVTQVRGWNLYPGWYGSYLNYFNEFINDQHARYPHHPLIVSEYGAGSDRRIHTIKPQQFDFSMEYQQIYVEHYVPVIENTPYIAGAAYWNFIDFGSAVREESMPRINNKGIVTSSREPKDIYYYFQCTWRNDKPIAHIAVRDWPKRTLVSDTDVAVMPIKVYSNSNKVSLTINGTTLPERTIENAFTFFDVPLQRGNNFIIATTADGSVCDMATVNVNFLPSTINSENVNNLELGINVGSDCWFVSDESGFSWVPDREYTPGGWGYVGGSKKSVTTQIHGTVDNPLYQTSRQDINAYRFDVPKGTYEIELGFADPFRDGNAIAYSLNNGGKAEDVYCRFNVAIEGAQRLINFAPSDASGHFYAGRHKYIVNVTDGTLDIDFSKVNGHTFLNCIKLRKL